MSAIHVLEGNGDSYRCICHFNMPAGNNSAGMPFKDAAKAAGYTGIPSVLPVGLGPGQIDSAEAAQVTAGDVAEVEVWASAESGGTSGAQRQASLTEIVNKQVAQIQSDWQRQLKYYGQEI